jgi:hypothetical protein
VDEVEAAAQLEPGRAHVLVHVVHPRDERVHVAAREVGLAHAVDDHAVPVLDRVQVAAAAREHVHLDAVLHELLGELAHVAGEPSLDDRRVLPAQDENARAHGA